jgi:hypothetical protein
MRRRLGLALDRLHRPPLEAAGAREVPCGAAPGRPRRTPPSPHEGADPACIPPQRCVEMAKRAKKQPLVRLAPGGRGLFGPHCPTDEVDLSPRAAIESDQPTRPAPAVARVDPGAVGAPSLVAEALELGVPAAACSTKAGVIRLRRDGGEQREGEQHKGSATLHSRLIYPPMPRTSRGGRPPHRRVSSSSASGGQGRQSARSGGPQTSSRKTISVESDFRGPSFRIRE